MPGPLERTLVWLSAAAPAIELLSQSALGETHLQITKKERRKKECVQCFFENVLNLVNLSHSSKSKKNNRYILDFLEWY